MNRMKGKKILAALGFFSIAGVAGGCSQPAPEIRYQIETDQPCQTMAYFRAQSETLGDCVKILIFAS